MMEKPANRQLRLMQLAEAQGLHMSFRESEEGSPDNREYSVRGVDPLSLSFTGSLDEVEVFLAIPYATQQLASEFSVDLGKAYGDGYRCRLISDEEGPGIAIEFPLSTELRLIVMDWYRAPEVHVATEDLPDMAANARRIVEYFTWKTENCEVDLVRAEVLLGGQTKVR